MPLAIPARSVPRGLAAPAAVPIGPPLPTDEAERAALRDLAGIADHELALHALALRDELTGLPNQRGFRPLATQALAACHRLGRPAALMLFRVRGPHRPDVPGRAAREDARRRFGQLLRQGLRGSDVAAWLGGDEFVAVLANADAARQAQALRRLQFAAAGTDAAAPALRFSVGVVVCQGATPADLDAMLAEADAAMGDGPAGTRIAASPGTPAAP